MQLQLHTFATEVNEIVAPIFSVMLFKILGRAGATLGRFNENGGLLALSDLRIPTNVEPCSTGLFVLDNICKKSVRKTSVM